MVDMLFFAGYFTITFLGVWGYINLKEYRASKRDRSYLSYQSNSYLYERGVKKVVKE